MRAISLDLVRVTEAAAISAYKWAGSGDKLNVDKAATDSMRERLNRMNFSAQIILGEGIKDKSHGLYYGELVGKLRTFPEAKVYDIAVDPVDGTKNTAQLLPEAISVIALAEKECLFHTNQFYMKKLAYGPQIKNYSKLSIKDPIEKTLEIVAQATRKDIKNVVVCVLDRPRHKEIIEQIRDIGAKLKLITDCDVSGAIATCLPEGNIDILYGTGGSPESVIAACAIKCLGGDFQAQLVDDNDYKVCDTRVYEVENLVAGPCVFAATGVTDGSLLKGVKYTSRGAVTNSVFMRSESGTIRWLTANHGN